MDVKDPAASLRIETFKKRQIENVREHSKLQPWKTAAAFLGDWGLIFGAAWASEAWFHPLTYLLAIALIAGRQHGLLILSHEGAHYRISPKAWWNDFVSENFAAYPIFFDTYGYRINHLKHHRHLNTDQDPDWARKIPLPGWQFPMSRSFVAKSVPGFLLWRGPLEWIQFSLTMMGVWPLKGLFRGEQLKRLAKRTPFYLAAFSAIHLTGMWTEFLMYWMLPYLFVYPAFQRYRSISEHFGLARTHEMNESRNVSSPWFESMFLGPHNVNLHLTHHMFPSVPFYNLPSLTEIFRKDETFRELAHENTTYLLPSGAMVLRDLLLKDEKKAPNAAPSRKEAA